MAWNAPCPTRSVDADLSVPGSKSATARALVLAGLASGPGSITAGLRARDTSLMIVGLRALGARVDDSGPTWQIEPIRQMYSTTRIDCGLAGTVMRFLPPIAALGGGSVEFFGDPAATERPMAGLLDALRQLGAAIDQDRLPFTVSGPISGDQATIDASASSQFVSALLLAAARFPGGLNLRHCGGDIPSMPHIEMTIAALAARGVRAQVDDRTWQVSPGPIHPLDEIIEPDATTASAFLAAALATGGRVSVLGWPSQTTQPGVRIAGILEQMGAVVELSSDRLTVHGTGQIRGIDVNLRQASELTPVVAALAALADTPSTIRGVAHIRGHETDRLAALSGGITALGGDCRETDDGLVVHPRPLHAGVFATRADHRLAHAGALIGLRVDGVVLDDVDCTSKTMPEFPVVWREMVE